VGRKEFYGLEFLVTPAAIIPRPETELLVETALAEARRLLKGKTAITLVDVGVGSGAIACAIAANLPEAHIVATDLSAQALALAQRNARRLELMQRIRFLHGDLLTPLSGPFDVITANLPYVKSSDWAQSPPEIRDHEPQRGLDGGSDGLRSIRRLLRQAPPYLNPDGVLLLEIDNGQGPAVRALARSAFPAAHIEVRPDLAGLNRLLLVCR
jgi:release factor glutamine methyltransferase